jgi:hypothetical protein
MRYFLMSKLPVHHHAAADLRQVQAGQAPAPQAAVFVSLAGLESAPLSAGFAAVFSLLVAGFAPPLKSVTYQPDPLS